MVLSIFTDKERWEIRWLGKPTRAAKNESQKPGGFNNTNTLSCGSGCCRCKIKVLAGLVPSEASLLGLQMAAFSLCPRMAFLCVLSPGVTLCPQSPSSLKRHQSGWIMATLPGWFHFVTCIESHIPGCGGSGLRTYGFGGGHPARTAAGAVTLWCARDTQCALTVPVSLLQSTLSLLKSTPFDWLILRALFCHCGIHKTGKEQMELQLCTTYQVCPPLLPLKYSLCTSMWLPQGNGTLPAPCRIWAEKADGTG